MNRSEGQNRQHDDSKDQSRIRPRPAGLGLILFSLIFLLAACQPKQELFPQVPWDVWSTATRDADDPATGTSAPDIVLDAELVIAAPFSQEVLEQLRLYYLASQAGHFADADKEGSRTLLSDSELQAFDAPLHLRLESVSLDQGAQADQLAVWAAAQQLPDIIYSASGLNRLRPDQLLDLSSYLADDSRLRPERIYAGMLPAPDSTHVLKSLPFLATVPLLYANQDLLSHYLAQDERDPGNWPDFLGLVQDLQQSLAEREEDLSWSNLSNIALLSESEQQAQLARTRTVLANPWHLAGWLPAQIDSACGWHGYDGRSFRADQAAAQKSWHWLTELVLSGYTPFHLSSEQWTAAGFDLPIVQNERALLWFDDSSRLASWHQQRQFAVSSWFVPLGLDSMTGSQAADLRTDDEQGTNGYINLEDLPFALSRLPVNVRSLTVPADTEDPFIAATLAAFIALDPYSLVVQSRYQLYEGFFPVVRDDMVWEALVSRQPYGYILADLRPRLESVLITKPYMAIDARLVEDTVAAAAGRLLAEIHDDNVDDQDEDDETGKLDRSARIERWLSELSRELNRLNRRD